MSSDPKLIPYILPIIEGSAILDIGCGYGKWGYLLKIDYWYTKSGRKRSELKYTVGIDAYIKYLKFVKHYRIYDDVILCDARCLPLRENSFTTVLVLEVVEHISKNEGRQLLKEAEQIANRLVIVSTPAYFIRQEARDCNLFQKHSSKWTVNDFVRLGYSIIMGSFLFERIHNYLQYFFYKLVRIFPQYPVSLIAIKRIST
jgi:SAM-dependent methyltransferase